MPNKHRTVLPSLKNALDHLRDEQVHPVGVSGLSGHGVSATPPEIPHPEEVSHTHPFTDRKGEE